MPEVGPRRDRLVPVAQPRSRPRRSSATRATIASASPETSEIVPAAIRSASIGIDAARGALTQQRDARPAEALARQPARAECLQLARRG